VCTSALIVSIQIRVWGAQNHGSKNLGGGHGLLASLVPPPLHTYVYAHIIIQSYTLQEISVNQPVLHSPLASLFSLPMLTQFTHYNSSLANQPALHSPAMNLYGLPLIDCGFIEVCPMDIICPQSAHTLKCNDQYQPQGFLVQPWLLSLCIVLFTTVVQSHV
jgi:hypothetical protein